MQIIRDLTAEAEPGKSYLGTVTRLVDFGAFVEILPELKGCFTPRRSLTIASVMFATN